MNDEEEDDDDDDDDYDDDDDADDDEDDALSLMMPFIHSYRCQLNSASQRKSPMP